MSSICRSATTTRRRRTTCSTGRSASCCSLRGSAGAPSCALRATTRPTARPSPPHYGGGTGTTSACRTPSRRRRTCPWARSTQRHGGAVQQHRPVGDVVCTRGSRPEHIPAVQRRACSRTCATTAEACRGRRSTRTTSPGRLRRCGAARPSRRPYVAAMLAAELAEPLMSGRLRRCSATCRGVAQGRSACHRSDSRRREHAATDQHAWPGRSGMMRGWGVRRRPCTATQRSWPIEAS